MLSKLKSFVLQSTLSKNWTGNPQKKKRQVRKKVKSLSPVQLFVTPWTVAHQAPQTMGFSRQARVGCHFLLQEIFWTQGLNPGLPHCRQTFYCLNHQGSPKERLFDLLKPISLVSAWTETQNSSPVLATLRHCQCAYCGGSLSLRKNIPCSHMSLLQRRALESHFKSFLGKKTETIS